MDTQKQTLQIFKHNTSHFVRDEKEEENQEKIENGTGTTTAPKKQPLSLEEMIARREAEKKAQEKVEMMFFILFF